MELLFKREQTSSTVSSRVTFKLWGKLEVSEDEQALIGRYCLDEAVLIVQDDTHVWQGAIKRGFIVLVVAAVLIGNFSSLTNALYASPLLALAAAYSYFNEERGTIFVKDLLIGRNFSCRSVVELAKKEAWLQGASGVLRQVMESAKHWDGVERHTIEPLPKEQARELIVRAP